MVERACGMEYNVEYGTLANRRHHLCVGGTLWKTAQLMGTCCKSLVDGHWVWG